MLAFFHTYNRPILEYACAVWHPALTKHQSHQIEQKGICKIILGKGYLSYEFALQTLSITTLEKILYWNSASRSSTRTDTATHFLINGKLLSNQRTYTGWLSDLKFQQQFNSQSTNSQQECSAIPTWV